MPMSKRDAVKRIEIVVRRIVTRGPISVIVAVVIALTATTSATAEATRDTSLQSTSQTAENNPAENNPAEELEEKESASETESSQENPARTRAEQLLQMRQERSLQLTPYEVSSTEARARRWEKAKFPTKWLVKGWRGFRPIIGGMPSGSGAVFGAGYIHGLESQYLQYQLNGRYSTRGYTMFDGELVYPPPQARKRLELKLNGAYRDLTSLRFYGLGNESDVDDRSTYLLNDKTVMGSAWFNPRGLVSFGAQGGIVRSRSDSGDVEPSVEDVFDPTPPGFGDETEHAVFGGWAEFDLRSKWVEPNVGVVFRVTGLRYEDRDLNQYDFTQLVGDFKAYIPLGPKNRILALRVRAQYSDPDDGHEVPFYLMETVGGAATIRGFREWRYRDRGNLLMSAEYRWEVWTYLDFSFFIDTGKVFVDTDELNFDGLKTGYGFGLRFHAPGGFSLRMDLANSFEGFKFHIGGGPSF